MHQNVHPLRKLIMKRGKTIKHLSYIRDIPVRMNLSLERMKMNTGDKVLHKCCIITTPKWYVQAHSIM